jgi:hypothetical protein
MGFGGGGGAQIDTAAQERQFAIEQQRLELERQSVTARQEERVLLERQLAQQQEINSEQVSLLQELNNQSIASEQALASLLNESTALARQQTGQQQSEQERAFAARQRSQEQATSAANSNALRRQQGVRQAPTSLFSGSERLSILSAQNI